MWSRYDGHGDGVRVSGVNRLTDELLNVRSRREHGTQAYLDVRQTSLEKIESGVGEPGDAGVSAALAELRSSFSDLANTPNGQAARAAVLTGASGVVDALRAQQKNVLAEAEDQSFRLVGDVSEVNTLAEDLASANASIAAGTLGGTDVGVLLDKRDQLTLRLSELTGSQATVRADGGADVTVNGVALVTGNRAATLTIASGTNPDGTPDGNPVTFAVTDGAGTTTVAGGAGGELGGVADLLNTTLPAYLDGLTQIATSLATAVNALHTAGYDQRGDAGTPLFSYDPADVLGTLTVAITDPALVAASSVPGNGSGTGNAGTGTAEALAAMPGVEGAYQRLVTGLGVQVNQAQRQSTNQQAVTGQVDSAREQLSGVNLDEEMVNMLAAQRAYESASRVMTTLDSVLDTLINRTGVR